MAHVECLQCYNKGCGQKFDPTKNTEDSCQYHPGVPVFHDALKGWSCCKRRSTDFTEFLNTPGCTKGQHSNVKPVEPEKPKNDTIEEEIVQEAPPPPKPIKPLSEPAPRPPVDEPLVQLKTTVGATLKQALEKQMKDLTLANPDTSAGDGSIPIGTSCKNNSCKKAYEGSSCDEETCLFHSGVPIFHEGLKYWSCCQRKTTEFDNFLNQEGCTKGKHLWFKKEDENKKVACRYDWHQTAGFVTISVFSKVANPDKSFVEANQVSLNIYIMFDGEKSIFDKKIILKGIIDPSKSSVKMLGTKVEITMKKAEPGSWPTLEMPQESSNS